MALALNRSSSILCILISIILTEAHHWSSSGWGYLALFSDILAHNNSLTSTIPITSTAPPTNATQVGTFAASTTSNMAPTSSSAMGTGGLSSVTQDTLVVPVLALSLALGVLLVLIACLSVFLCRRRSRMLAPINRAAVTTAADQRGQLSIHPPTSTNYETAKKLPSAPNSSQPVQSSQDDPSKLRRRKNPLETQLPSAIQKVEESLLESQSFRAIEARTNDEALSRAVLAAFSPGQDEVFHPQVLDLIVEDNLTKEAVRQMVPMKPKPGTVMPGYNPKLDEERPQEIGRYLQAFRILFVVDDSCSMKRRWQDTRDALGEIAKHALKFYSDAVDIRFFNHHVEFKGAKGADKVVEIFGQVHPTPGTPTGRVLKEVLDEQIQRLDVALSRGSYSSELPLDIIVLTDGVPDHNSPPAPVIEEAAIRLRERKHHPNWIAIQFVQIGNDTNAKPTLLSLDGPNNDMVNTVSYDEYKAQGNGTLTAAALEEIILGNLHPNLRAYWNQWRRKKYEKTSQVIY